MGRQDHINAVLTAVHDSGLIGATALEICDKLDSPQNRVTASLYGLFKQGAVRRDRDRATGHFRYWYLRERFAGEDLPPVLQKVEKTAVPEMALTFVVPLFGNDCVRLSLGEARTLYNNLKSIFGDS
jgi:predicted transcriptional regulator